MRCLIVCSVFLLPGCSHEATPETVQHDGGREVAATSRSEAGQDSGRTPRDDTGSGHDASRGSDHDAIPDEHRDACVCKFTGSGSAPFCTACATATNPDGSACDWATEICNIGADPADVYATCTPKPCDASVITETCFTGTGTVDNCGIWTTLSQE